MDNVQMSGRANEELKLAGRLAESGNASVLKTVVRVTPAWVQILHLPLSLSNRGVMMRKVGKAVISSSGKIVLAKSQFGNAPIAFINFTLVRDALSAAGLPVTVLDIMKNEALIELAQHIKENDF
jgi:hypothetical protein